MARTMSLSLYRMRFYPGRALSGLFIFIAFFGLGLGFSAAVPAKPAGKPVAEPATQAEYLRTRANYQIPDVTLVRKDGEKVRILQEISDDRPVLVNFIYTSCGAICPMLSHLFSVTEQKLTKKRAKFHLISFSIDPENDTPAKLAEYSVKFHAGSNWDHYTGSLKDITAIQKAMNVFRGDKMNHSSVILLRPAQAKGWVRLEGFLSPDQIIHELENSTQ